jgi:hypothetical protein
LGWPPLEEVDVPFDLNGNVLPGGPVPLVVLPSHLTVSLIGGTGATKTRRCHTRRNQHPAKTFWIEGGKVIN